MFSTRLCLLQRCALQIQRSLKLPRNNHGNPVLQCLYNKQNVRQYKPIRGLYKKRKKIQDRNDPNIVTRKLKAPVLSVFAENSLRNAEDHVQESESSTDDTVIGSSNFDFEELHNLLLSKNALETPASDIVFDKNVNDEQIEQYLTQKQLDESTSYGATSDYVEHLSGAKLTEQSVDRNDTSVFLYGSPDPDVPISEDPCVGCGALLHCQDPGIPGYMPSQKYLSISMKDLKFQLCQRCFMLEEYELALNVKTDPRQFLHVLREIRKKSQALIVLVVDVMDLPNSILFNVLDLVGPYRPLHVIVNKIDLLPKDSIGYLERAKGTVRSYLNQYGVPDDKIKHITLVSARTGFNIEKLVTMLMNVWKRKGDVYVVGCTNVGKSTLFNALLSSDYCKRSARDFIHRATVSNWPGTTLNTLKFPIVSPSDWRLKQRARRLNIQREEEVEEETLRKSMYKSTGNRKFVTLMGHIGQTFLGKKDDLQMNKEYEGYTGSSYRTDPNTGLVQEFYSKEEQLARKEIKRQVETYNESLYSNSWWCYDTPGVVCHQQIINLLTQQELSVMLAGIVVQPRTFIVHPGITMFVTGLGRIDYLKGKGYIYFTVLCNDSLPVHIVDTTEADKFYQKYCGTETLGVPLGNKERLETLPALLPTDFNITGIGNRECAADISLSSLGWVAVTAGMDMEVSVRAYTPNAYGCQLRKPALLCHAVRSKGKRVRGARNYGLKKPLLFDKDRDVKKRSIRSSGFI